MEGKPHNRRWLRFSLRALLAVITLICCWLAWETRSVQNRKALRKEAQAAGYNFVTAVQYEDAMWSAAQAQGAPHPPYLPPAKRLSFVRRMLGDEAIHSVYFYGHNLPAERFSQVQKAFPEADFQEVFPQPCHPGCFPAGTLVETQAGLREIQMIAVEEVVTAVSPTGETSTVKVQTIFVTKNTLWEVETVDGVLVTTETQPLCLASGEVRQAGKLAAGDMLQQWKDQTIQEVQVLSVKSTGRTAQVFNLVLGDSEVFIAGGYLARSKPPALPINE